MKAFPALLCGALLGCVSETPVKAGDREYHLAELRVIEMKYLDYDGQRELFVIQADGVVVANGKPICRVEGTQIETPDGKMMVTVAPDGTVTGPRAPPEARFDGKNQLRTKHGTLSMLVPPPVQGNPMERASAGMRYLDARMMLMWNDGSYVKLRGAFPSFDQRATRLALLLATILLMKPGTLDNPPPAGSTPP